MDLCLASHRAVLKALQAFEEGELALLEGGPLTIATPHGELRFLDGVCFAAPDAGWIGSELVGWLDELEGLSGVGAWWRPGLRAVLRTRRGTPAVTAPSQDLVLGGAPASLGVATHAARFVVAHGDAAPGHRPAPVSPPPRARAPRPTAPLDPQNDGALRERGVWRSTAVVPWTLGQGRNVARSPRETLGPLPTVLSPPRAHLYTPTPTSVHIRSAQTTF